MEEKKGRIDAVIEWARNKCGHQISLRFARKYLEDDTHVWSAVGDAQATISQEKEATPSRTPDDIRVRKIPAPAPSVNENHPIQGIDRTETHRGEIGYTREHYLAAVEDIKGRPQPIERFEQVAASSPEMNDGYADCTVEAPDRMESGRQSHRGAIENIWEHVESLEKTQQGDSDLPGDGGHAAEQDEGEGAIEASAARVAKEVVSVEGFMSDSPRKKAQVPWLRVLMFLSYLAFAAAMAVSESATQRTLRDARAREVAEEYDAALEMYSGIVNVVPLSFGTIEAGQSLRRLCQLRGRGTPEPLWLPAVKKLLGSNTPMPDVHLLPLVTWPVCSAVLLVVLVTRIRRPAIVFLSLLLMAVAVAGSVVQFVWYGSTSLPSVTEAVGGLMRATPNVYYASYLLLVVTALMTLTATAKRQSPRVAKPEELWDGIDLAGHQEQDGFPNRGGAEQPWKRK